MNTERDRIIERFMNGEMSPSEERDFNSLLEVDEELRRMLNAEKFVRNTMQKDRGALAGIDQSRTYAYFLRGLAASVPAAQLPSPTSSAGAGSGGATGGAGAGAGGTVGAVGGTVGKLAVLAKLGLGAKIATTAMAVIGAAAVTVAVVQGTRDDASERVAPPAIEAVSDTTVERPMEPRVDQRVELPTPVQRDAVDSATTPAATPAQSVDRSSDDPRETDRPATIDRTEPRTPARQDRNDIPIFEDDTIRTHRAPK